MATKSLRLLFDRPCEPIITIKGDNCIFDVPHEYLTERFQALDDNLNNRLAEDNKLKKIPVKNMNPAEFPNLNSIMSLRRDEGCSLWIPKHNELAGTLIDYFMGMKSVDDLLSFGVYARDRVNPYLFQYCLATSILHRPDTRNEPIPSLLELFPDEFVDSQVKQKIREETYVLGELYAEEREPIEVYRDKISEKLNPEQKLWYFREDAGVNLHHWHWHLVYPYNSTNLDLVNKDRRGELFFYAHEQILARYNFERLANNLERTKPFGPNLREKMDEGYYPKLNSNMVSRDWPARHDGAIFQNINRPKDRLKIDVNQLELWHERIIAAIDREVAENVNGERILLSSDGSTDKGIDILGNMIESSRLTPNKNYYGELHNSGHDFISLAHDPRNKHLEDFGVMNSPGTAMRDPMFYRWHTFIDGLFQRYKERQTPYTTSQLTFPDITVESVQIQIDNGLKNIFQTFWFKTDVDFSRGIDFQERGNVFVRFQHLTHTPFKYNIQINNASNQNKIGLCRIFMAPRYDEVGQELYLMDQRLLMIEMDKFTVQLNPGSNVIRRTSEQSSVTIPFEQTFRNVDNNRAEIATEAADIFNVCGCGWPQHMLVPKGTVEGMDCDLFVMVSNYELDKVDQEMSAGTCTEAASYCGIRDRKFPDLRPMGYPFDRLPRTDSDTLQKFLTPNMKVQSVKITHENTVILRPE